jgi:hypothetical protein
LKAFTSATPLAMTEVLTRPSTRAPTNSNTAAMSTAWRMVRVLLPTEVAKALATSLLPVAKPKAKAAKAPTTMNQVYLQARSTAAVEKEHELTVSLKQPVCLQPHKPKGSYAGEHAISNEALRRDKMKQSRRLTLA